MDTLWHLVLLVNEFEIFEKEEIKKKCAVLNEITTMTGAFFFYRDLILSHGNLSCHTSSWVLKFEQLLIIQQFVVPLLSIYP